MILAPIVLFVYNRPWHTKQTIEALQKNELANQSELIIYSDAPKNSLAQADVDEVREYIKSIDGFKKVIIIERDTNWGLASSIIDGVTTVVNKRGRIIVLEDDLVTSPYFLRFMNDALEFYKDEDKVWHISGWNYPIDPNGLDDVFLWRGMNCWGWSTWKEKWQYFEKNADDLIATFSKKDIHRFNLATRKSGFWGQVVANKHGGIDTWAIFWYATIFKKRGLCLNPSQTLVRNTGIDGSGIHCGDIDSYLSDMSKAEINIRSFNKGMEENFLALSRINNFYSVQTKPFFIRAINKISRIIFDKKQKICSIKNTLS